MKILAIMGSPRKGESYQATQMFEAAMKQMGEVEFEYVFLKNIHLGSCLGCHACIRFGEEKCPLRDDRAMLEEKMMAADGLVLVSPVYALQVTALMKNYLDHFSYCWHRPRFFGKQAAMIASGGGMFKETLGYMATNAFRWGYQVAVKVGVPHPDSLVPKERAKLECNIQKSAARFYRAVESGKAYHPGLMDLLWFRMWRLTARAGRDFTPRDFSWYTEKGWFEQDYYSPVRLSPLTRLAANLGEKLLQRMMRSLYVGY